MSTSISATKSTRRTAASVVMLLLTVLTAIVGISPASAGGSTYTTPTAMTVTASTDNTGLGGSAVPTVLAQVGDPINLTITLYPQDAAFNTDTTLSVAASLQPSPSVTLPAHGTFSPYGSRTTVMPAGQHSWTVKVTYSAVDNSVVATVQPKNNKGANYVTPGTTAPFDILKTLNTFPASDSFNQTVGTNNCGTGTTDSVCGILSLSNGIGSSKGALSIGACTTDLGCTAGSEVVQFVADLGDPQQGTNLYDQYHPATLVFRCEKSLCPGKSISAYPLHVSFSAAGPLSLTPAPCVAKGQALGTDGMNYCVDMVQTHRDGVGALLEYLLFVDDLRGSM